MKTNWDRETFVCVIIYFSWTVNGSCTIFVDTSGLFVVSFVVGWRTGLGFKTDNLLAQVNIDDLAIDALLCSFSPEHTVCHCCIHTCSRWYNHLDFGFGRVAFGFDRLAPVFVDCYCRHLRHCHHPGLWVLPLAQRVPDNLKRRWSVDRARKSLRGLTHREILIQTRGVVLIVVSWSVFIRVDNVLLHVRLRSETETWKRRETIADDAEEKNERERTRWQWIRSCCHSRCFRIIARGIARREKHEDS